MRVVAGTGHKTCYYSTFDFLAVIKSRVFGKQDATVSGSGKWPKWSGGTEDHFGCNWLPWGAPARAPLATPVALPRAFYTSNWKSLGQVPYTHAN